MASKSDLREKLLPDSTDSGRIIAPSSTQEQILVVTFNVPKNENGASVGICCQCCQPPKAMGFKNFSYPMFIQDIMTEDQWNTWTSKLMEDIRNSDLTVGLWCRNCLLSLIPFASCFVSVTTVRDHQENINRAFNNARKAINDKYKQKGLHMSWQWEGKKEAISCCDCKGRSGPVIKYHKITVRLQRAYHDLSAAQQRSTPRPSDFTANMATTAAAVPATAMKAETFGDFLKRLGLEPYRKKLADEGFDTIASLLTLESADIEYMKKGHSRALLREIAKMNCAS